MIDGKECALRRDKLFETLQNDSIVILYAGVSIKKSAYQYYDFRVNSNFYYLTNISQEGSILLISKQDGIVSECLFINENDPNLEKWVGKRLTLEEAKEASGINNVLSLNMFNSELDLLLQKKKSALERIKYVYLDLEKENILEDFNTTENVKMSLSLNYPWLEFYDIYPQIVALRQTKSNGEIVEIKNAISDTNIGIKAVLKRIRSEVYEYQLASLFDYTVKDYSNAQIDRKTIVSSGVNSCSLGYKELNRKIKNNDLVMIECETKSNEYSASITRTFPVGKSFDDSNIEIYKLVLNVNKMLISMIHPGINLTDLNKIAIKNLAEGLVNLGIINNESEIKKYFYHPAVAHIGLDNPEPICPNAPLTSGSVLLVQPAVYIKEKELGIRIKDVVLVTDDGSYCVSNSIIKEIDDIEKAMGSR